MDKIKNFFNKKKMDKKFKKIGPGHLLTEPSPNRPSISPGSHQRGGPPTAERIFAADVAAQAAYKRMEHYGGVKAPESRSQQKIKLEAKRQLDEERRQREQSFSTGIAYRASSEGPEIREFEHAHYLPGVFFTCELLGDEIVLPKQELRETVGEFLIQQLEEEPLVPAVLMLYTLNSERKRLDAIEIIQKYLENIMGNPDNEKYRRIRLKNATFQEKVASARGAREILLGCGFFETMESGSDGSQEPYLVMPAPDDVGLVRLREALDLMADGTPVPMKLHRDPKIFHLQPNQSIPQPDIPPDFYTISSAEVKDQQANKTAEVDRLLSLRTKEMRKLDETLRQYTYKYTIIRVFFPDRHVLQGTFGCYEKFDMVREFVDSQLARPGFPFALIDPISGVAFAGDKSLGDLNLAPAAKLHFEWDQDVAVEWNRCGQPIPYLDQQLVGELLQRMD